MSKKACVLSSAMSDFFSALPCEVIPGVFLGNELHAASLEVLRVLNIGLVLNVGVPQCIDHFKDRGIRYLSCELFDNVESNFSNVFLHQAYPCLTDAIQSEVNEEKETKNSLYKKEKKKKKKCNVLVHCKSGLSKGPSIIAGLLMLRFNMDVVGSVGFLVNDAGYSRLKISDHLLGELLLLQDAKGNIELPAHAMPEWELDEEERPAFAVAFAEVEGFWQKQEFDKVCEVSRRSEAWSRLVRFCLWKQPAAKVAVGQLSDWCGLIRRLEATLPSDLYNCIQFDSSSTLGMDLAELLNNQLTEVFVLFCFFSLYGALLLS